MPEMKMQPSELRELHEHIAKVAAQDFHLGRVLTLIVHHLGHAHGLDLTQMNEDEAKKQEDEARKLAATKPDPESENDAENEEEEAPVVSPIKKGKAIGN